MKKALLCFVLLAALCLSACGGVSGKPDNMTLARSTFSQETQDVLKLVEDEMVFFDYAVDESIRSSTASLWVYQDGAWNEIGNMSGNLDQLENRIAFRLNESGFAFWTIDESGYTKSSYKPEAGMDLSAATSVLTHRLESPMSIVPGEEIALLVKLGSSKETGMLSVQEDFRQSPCDLGVAVTITFSDKVVS